MQGNRGKDDKGPVEKGASAKKKDGGKKDGDKKKGSCLIIVQVPQSGSTNEQFFSKTNEEHELGVTDLTKDVLLSS